MEKPKIKWSKLRLMIKIKNTVTWDSKGIVFWDSGQTDSAQNIKMNNL